MKSRDTAGRIPCWQRHQGGKVTLAAGGSGAPRRPRVGKDLLGAAMTLAIIGAIVLQVTNRLASQCGPGPGPHMGPGACSGLPAIASHVQRVMTLGVIACTALAAIAFVWYMLWGYRLNGNQDT